MGRGIPLPVDIPALTEDSALEIDDRSFFKNKLGEAVRAIPDEILRLSELELSDRQRPTPIDYALRKRVTELIEEAKRTGKDEIQAKQIYNGLLAPVNFVKMLNEPVALAFMIRPVVHHAVYYDAILKEGLKKLFHYVRNHDLDPKTMATFSRIVEKAGDRAIGPVVQKIAMHQKQEVTHTSGDPREVNANPDDPAQLEAKIREMQAKLHKSKPLEIEVKSLSDED